MNALKQNNQKPKELLVKKREQFPDHRDRGHSALSSQSRYYKHVCLRANDVPTNNRK